MKNILFLAVCFTALVFADPTLPKGMRRASDPEPPPVADTAPATKQVWDADTRGEVAFMVDQNMIAAMKFTAVADSIILTSRGVQMTADESRWAREHAEAAHRHRMVAIARLSP